MKPTASAYTAVLPWYERDDFLRLWEMADDKAAISPDYEVWHRAATEVLTTWLARGRTLQIVTIRPAEFAVWLSRHGLANTAEIRLRYVREMSGNLHVTDPKQEQSTLPEEGHA